VPSSTSWRAEIDATDIEESLALSGELPFQFIRVIALAAGPRFSPFSSLQDLRLRACCITFPLSLSISSARRGNRKMENQTKGKA
jgi:hypothetical protein